MTSLELATKIAQALDSKKALQIKVLRIDEISSLADYFVLATGTSNTQVHALSDEVERKLQQEDATAPDHIEGYRSNTWVLMDYSHVIVHIFTPDAREFYDLDRLWKDAAQVEVDFE